jgi:hypothetical protein
MSELQIQKIEKADIKTPHLQDGESAIVFQRHERYQRDRTADNTGSLITEHAEAAYLRDVNFFEELFAQDADGSETMLLFTSSDTQYADGGYRSIETAQLAQDAAIEVLDELGIEPYSRIINLNASFNTNGFDTTNQSIRPDAKIREPQIFDTPDYIDMLREKYGEEDGPGTGISPKAWAMHEMDAEKEAREGFGAEGVYDMLDRAKKSVKIMDRYSKVFHANNPNKKLLIWTASHYDTISPLVKDATKAGFDEYVPVDYGAGVIIELSKDEEPVLHAQGQKVKLDLASTAINRR